MRRTVTVENWTLAVVPHAAGFDARTRSEVEASPYLCLPARVPGNFELDLMEAGLLEDLYYGENIIKAQQLEDRHLWYSAGFELEDAPGKEAFLCFGGIDAAAEIYLDGALLDTVRNMLIPYEYSLKHLAAGAHEVVVHILPAALYGMEHPTPPSDAAAWCTEDRCFCARLPICTAGILCPASFRAVCGSR